jgi:hypothetical protein
MPCWYIAQNQVTQLNSKGMCRWSFGGGLFNVNFLGSCLFFFKKKFRCCCGHTYQNYFNVWTNVGRVSIYIYICTHIFPFLQICSVGRSSFLVLACYRILPYLRYPVSSRILVTRVSDSDLNCFRGVKEGYVFVVALWCWPCLALGRQGCCV